MRKVDILKTPLNSPEASGLRTQKRLYFCTLLIYTQGTKIFSFSKLRGIVYICWLSLFNDKEDQKYIFYKTKYIKYLYYFVNILKPLSVLNKD